MKVEEGTARIGKFQVEYSGYSDTGRLRSINEDDFLLLPDKGVFCLADGLGGLERGEVASVAALKSIRTILAAENQRQGFLFRKKTCSLQHMINHANSTVYNKRKELQLNTATTMLIVQFREYGFEVAHVGDSRAYIWNGIALTRCTRDHSLVEELFRTNGFTEQQLLEHPQRHVITRAVGAGKEVKAKVQSFDIKSGNLVLLCSDGLTTMLTHSEIESILQTYHGDIIRAGRVLIRAANNAGGRDNITVILLHVTAADSH
jgi:protein phosphatase